VPDFIKSLADVKKGRCTILMVFCCLIYGVREAMALLYCRVGSSKSKLVVWYPALLTCVFSDLFVY